MLNFYTVTVITTLITWILFIPFIGLLYKLKIQKKSEGRTGLLGEKAAKFQKLHAHKKGTPIGGGILVVLVTGMVFLVLNSFIPTLNIFKSALLLLALIIYGAFGFYDDLRKILPNKKGKIFHIKAKHQLVIHFIIGGLISYFGIRLNLIHISVPGVFSITDPNLLFALSTLTVVFMTNAYNITDGLDGLGSGLLLITLTSLVIIFFTVGAGTELLFISILFGATVAYLYYNIYPARMFNGDAGTFAIGSTLTLLFLMNDLWYLLPILGFVYVADALSSLFQSLSKKYVGKPIFKIAPIHHHFEMLGWHETKVTMRFWVLGIISSILGLAIYFSL